jgi:class 3 adenylate cyclase
LPGYKHENDSAHALLCAHHIFQDLTVFEKLKQTSIGVTTGLTYCGVVGHNHRHEYTVIGRKVNMAARLMMHYPGKARFTIQPPGGVVSLLFAYIHLRQSALRIRPYGGRGITLI